MVTAGLYYGLADEVAQETWVWCYTQERLVPLTYVHAEAVVVETTAEVKITQKYLNRRGIPSSSSFFFLLLL